jgi:hypothetical protein
MSQTSQQDAVEIHNEGIWISIATPNDTNESNNNNNNPNSRNITINNEMGCGNNQDNHDGSTLSSLGCEGAFIFGTNGLWRNLTWLRSLVCSIA